MRSKPIDRADRTREGALSREVATAFARGLKIAASEQPSVEEWTPLVQRIAAAAAKQERERCAKVANAHHSGHGETCTERAAGKRIAAAIRAEPIAGEEA